MVALVRRTDGWLLAAAPPQRLAVLRIAVGGYGLVNLIVSVGEFARLANRPADEFEPVGAATWLTGPVAPSTLWAFYAVSLLAAAAFTTGSWFRVSGPLFGLCTLGWASYHASWGQMLHFEHLLVLFALIIGLSPAADALQARSSSEAQTPAAHVRYGWPVRLLAIVTVVTYCLAGVAKLRAGGLAWVDGSTLANHIAYSATRQELLGEPRPPLASLAVRQTWLIQPMAVSSLAVELLAPLALLGGWFRRLWVPAAIVFHLGTLTTMFVFFPFNGLGFALLPLFRAERLVERYGPAWRAVRVARRSIEGRGLRRGRARHADIR